MTGRRIRKLDNSGPEGANDPLYVYKKLRLMLIDSYYGQRYWSFANGFFTVMIVTFSSIAAVLAKTGDISLPKYNIPSSSIASALSIAVTIASTIQTKLGFERKWAANRATQSALRQLRLDEASGRPKSEIEDALKRIINTHDQSIIGANT